MPPTPPVNPNPIQPAPAGLPNMATPPIPTTNKSSRMIYWIIGIILVVLVIGAGLYWYMIRKQAATSVSQTVSTNTPAPSPSDTIDSMGQELNSIDATASDSAGFNSVNSDLQGL